MFGIKNGRSYCRACLGYNRPSACISKMIQPLNVPITLAYTLTKEQIALSNQLLSPNQEIYVKAVCGAGKTEITFAVIQQHLRLGMRVGIAIPRKEIVKELYSRIQSAFIGVRITTVYGGHDQDLEGDIIILTTHQCYRYRDKFGLLIVDEYDAFPFVNNQILHRFVAEACYGKSIYLSATFDKEDIQSKVVFELNKRHHNQPLPVPKLMVYNPVISFLKIHQYLRKNLESGRYFFIYVPTIKMGRWLSCVFKMIGIQNLAYSSQSESTYFFQIKKGLHPIVITTTILERGITMKNLQVIVWNSNHRVFDFKTLVQIAGRAGRSVEYPRGDVLFFSSQQSKLINDVIKHILNINEKMS